ncbi:MAG: helix-turn-helix domain-containing protein [Actinomycetota bacterium]|nr:helix-turn-helix domain-containing protein [Actinomycetota bacterium]
MPTATRVIRHESETGCWEVLLRKPNPRLQGEVLVLEDYAERVAGPVRQRHLPPVFIPLIFNFGPRYRLLDPLDPAFSTEYGSFLAGLSESGAVTESPGTARCVQVNLTPLGARRLFGMPMHELAERVVPLVDLLGREAARLEERLAEAPDAGARTSLVESFLVARLADAPRGQPAVAYAWSRLVQSGGRLQIGALAAEVGCSRKHLAQQFRDQVGLAPKAAARLVRFNEALRLMRRGLSGAEVAVRCGYSDQAHFVKEFRSFSSSTPTALARAEEVRFLQDFGAVAA